MQYRFTKIGLLCAIVVSPGVARADTAIDVYKTEVAALRKEVDALKSALQGAVVAFDRKKMQPCPDGWHPFEQAGGRFVVGAGFNKNASKAGSPLFYYPSIQDDAANGTGGEERVTLSETQIPAHQHSVYWHADYHASQGTPPPSGAVQGANAGDTYTYVWPGVTSKTGGGKPFEVLPPFVALYYCIKE